MSEPHHINVRRSLLNPHPRDDRHARHAAHASRHRHVATEAHATDRKNASDEQQRKPRHRQQQTQTHADDNHTRKQGNPRSRTNQAQPQGHPDTAYAINATTPGNHAPQGARSLAARNALITAQPQVKGNHHGHTPTGVRPPRRRGEPPRRSRDKEKIRVPARVSQARREHPADNTRDPSGQQRNRTPPTIT